MYASMDLTIFSLLVFPCVHETRDFEAKFWKITEFTFRVY